MLLGAHPPELPVRELVRIANEFGIGDSTLRVTLTRMVAAGDLHRTGSDYRLSERLVERQRRQDGAVHPLTIPWDGSWEMCAVTATGRNASDRAALRTRLAELRLAELREGVWLRPANLARRWPVDIDDLVQRFNSRPETDAHRLALSLWDLDEWAGRARSLLQRFRDAETPADTFTLAAAIVRMLLSDPVLPDQLLPRHPWPADTLRAAYREYQNGLVDLIASNRTG